MVSQSRRRAKLSRPAKPPAQRVAFTASRADGSATSLRREPAFTLEREKGCADAAALVEKLQIE
jgi:hypothetical protein